MPEISQFFGHHPRLFRHGPAIAKKTLTARLAPRLEHGVADVDAGVVAQSEVVAAFQFRGRRLQDDLSLHVGDGDIAAAVEKAHRPQRLDDQALDLRRRRRGDSLA